MIDSGSNITIGDGSVKRASDIKVGDRLICADQSTCVVTHSETNAYRNKLRILRFKQDKDFCFTEASTFLVRHNNKTTYWVDHPSILLFQINFLKINNSVISNKNNIVAEHTVEFGTRSGYKKQTILDVTETYLDKNNLFLTTIRTDGYQPILVNDYFYIPTINDIEYDYSNVNVSL